MRRLPVLLFLPSFAGVLLALAPASAAAHARLLDAGVRAGTLSVAFGEPVTPVGRALRVYGRSGARVDQGPVLHPAGQVLEVAVTGSPPYRVRWSVVASDTHPGEGSFDVSDDGLAAVDAGSPGDVGGPGLALEGLSRWLHFAGLALVLGLALAGASATAGRLPLAGAMLLLAAELLWLGGQLVSLGAFDEASLTDVVAGPGGRVMALRLGGALAAWAFLGIADRPRLRTGGLIASGLALTLVDGLAAHRIAGWPPGTRELLNAVHEGGMAAWTGAVVAAACQLRPAAALTRPALAGAALAIVSGAGLAMIHVPLTAPPATPYVLLLAVKVAAVAGAVAFGARTFRRARPGIPEPSLLLLVTLVAAFLVSIPPPR